MFTLSDFQDLIEGQFLHNRNKSLFYELKNGRFVLSPSTETILYSNKELTTSQILYNLHI